MKRIPKKYLKVWIAFVNINAEEGYDFPNLIDSEGKPKEDYVGAVAYIAIIAKDIYEALEILPKGLHELHFKTVSIYEVRNAHFLMEYEELSDSDKEEIDWLLKSKYIFKILDRLWPYVEL